MKSNLFFLLWITLLVIYLKNSSTNWRSPRFAMYLLYRFVFYDSFWVNFVKGVRSVSRYTFSSSFFLHVGFQLFRHHLLKRLSFLHSIALVRDQLTTFVWVCFWFLYSIPLTSLSSLSPTPQGLSYCSFTVLMSGSVGHATMFFSKWCWLFWVFCFYNWTLE